MASQQETIEKEMARLRAENEALKSRLVMYETVKNNAFNVHTQKAMVMLIHRLFSQHHMVILNYRTEHIIADAYFPSYELYVIYFEDLRCKATEHIRYSLTGQALFYNFKEGNEHMIDGVIREICSIVFRPRKDTMRQIDNKSSSTSDSD